MSLLADFRPVLGAFCLLAALLAGGCGFSPVYGSHNNAILSSDGAAVSGLDSIRIGNIPDREGQYLRNALIDRFYRGGYPADPRYMLEVSTIAERRTNLDITRTADATRAQLRLSTTIRLIDEKDDTILLRRNLNAITSYNILESQFTTRVSEQNARQNALDDLARQIEKQLALYFVR